MHKPKNRRHFAIAATLVLIGAVAGIILANRAVPEPNAAAQADTTQSPQVVASGQDARPAPVDSLPPSAESDLSSSPSPAATGTAPQVAVVVIDEELATKLPSWLPLPENLAAIEGEDVARRSDGFFSGMLHLTLSAEESNPIETYADQLVASGLNRQGNGFEFQSADESQHCELRFTSTAAESPRFTLVYEGFSHDEGCACPGCGLDANLEQTGPS